MCQHNKKHIQICVTTTKIIYQYMSAQQKITYNYVSPQRKTLTNMCQHNKKHIISKNIPTCFSKTQHIAVKYECVQHKLTPTSSPMTKPISNDKVLQTDICFAQCGAHKASLISYSQYQD